MTPRYLAMKAPRDFSGQIHCNAPNQSGKIYELSAPGATLELVDERDQHALMQLGFMAAVKGAIPFSLEHLQDRKLVAVLRDVADRDYTHVYRQDGSVCDLTAELPKAERPLFVHALGVRMSWPGVTHPQTGSKYGTLSNGHRYAALWIWPTDFVAALEDVEELTRLGAQRPQ
jgi:hypothetical protein